MNNFEQIIDAIVDLNYEEEQALALGIMIGMTFSISGANKRHSETATPEQEKPHRQYTIIPPIGTRGAQLSFYVENAEVAFDAIRKFLDLFDDISPVNKYVPAKSLFDILEVTPSAGYDALRHGWKEMSLSDIRMEEGKDGTCLLSFPAPEDYGEDGTVAD